MFRFRSNSFLRGLLSTTGQFACVCYVLGWVAGASAGGVELAEIEATYLSGFERSDLNVVYRSGYIDVLGVSGSNVVNFQEDLTVYTQLPADNSLPSILGRVNVQDGVLRFSPLFPLQKGLEYFVAIGASLTGKTYYTFSIPASELKPEATVSQIFPTASELPANLLKFYLHFSHPMSLGDSYSHIRLLDENGDSVELPFLELGEELWDREGKRLTLLFDPGRIKSGLKPRMENGSILREDERYTLVIADSWKDAEGQPLKKGFEKEFSVVQPDIESPRLDNWNLKVPEANSKSELRLEFPEALDEALLSRVLLVLDSNDRVVEGSIRIDYGEQRWSFEPREAWREGGYRVQVETILEDVSGNSVGRPFEVEIRRSEEHLRPPGFAYLEFAVE